MSKIALMTESTDGLGKIIAFELASVGYTMHLLGRNARKGNEVLEKIRTKWPDREHQFFLVNLATVKSNKDFLKYYTKQYNKLDLLILNASAIPKKIRTTEDGIEQTFAVGYLSRYIFSLLLNPLLERGANARVVHIGEGSYTGNIPYEQLNKPKFGKLKATYYAYIADGYFTYFVNKLTAINTPHEYYHLGFVNTLQTKKISYFIRKFGDWFGYFIASEEAGKLFLQHIMLTKAKEVAGKYYSMGKLKNHSKKLKNAEAAFKELITFSEKITNATIGDYTL